MADQLKMYKLDVEKKDRLINELSNYREVERVQVCNHNHDSYIDKSTFEQNKREMSSLSAKYESIQNEVNILKFKNYFSFSNSYRAFPFFQIISLPNIKLKYKRETSEMPR